MFLASSSLNFHQLYVSLYDSENKQIYQLIMCRIIMTRCELVDNILVGKMLV